MVERLIWDQEAAGSSPVSPTIQTHTANQRYNLYVIGSNPIMQAFCVLINGQIERMIYVSSIQPRSVIGNTTDFDSVVVGSSPAGAANTIANKCINGCAVN